jgi:phosphoglycolate phosphatase
MFDSCAITPACILFDLDGTLLDTAPDMAQALNLLLQEQGKSVLPLATIRPVVSHGSPGLLKLGFNITPEHDEFGALRDRFLVLYSAAIAVETCLFPGMDSVLTALERRAIPWGVVTNKPGWLTEPLLTALKLDQRSACAISGDTLSKRKPDPEPLLHACRLIGIAPVNCLYVGDAERDIEAGRRAGMTTAVACYGYRHLHENPAAWGADVLIDTPEELLNWLGWRIAS